MATHFICQSTEPLPHVYSAGLARSSHGAVSQYEVYNTSNKPHTTFPPPGWDFSQSSEDDSLPLLLPAPKPHTQNASVFSDPDLCITPQKTKVSREKVSKSYDDLYTKPDFDPDPNLALTPMKSPLINQNEEINNEDRGVNSGKGKKQRVRFDLDDSISCNSLNENTNSFTEKTYNPEWYGNTEKELNDEMNKHTNQINAKDKTGIRTVKYTVGKVKNQPVYIPLDDNRKEEQYLKEVGQKESLACNANNIKVCQNNVSVQNVGKKGVKVVREKETSNTKSGTDKELIDTIMTSQIAVCSEPKRKVKVLRENQFTQKETEYAFPFNQDAADFACADEHIFARPEYNSTLRMKLEAEKLKESSIDIELALQKTLKASDATKAEINEKAASLVNSKGVTFTGLVSVNLPVEEICKQAAELKTARAKQIKMPKSRLKDVKEPDLMEFFSGDRQKESVMFSLNGISAPSEHLSSASHMRAFDLYKHNRAWESRLN